MESSEAEETFDTGTGSNGDGECDREPEVGLPENSSVLDSSEQPGFSTTLHDQSRFFIKQDGTSELQAAKDNAGMIHINLDQNNDTEEGDGIPVLLHVAEDGSISNSQVLDGKEGKLQFADAGSMATTMYTIHLTESKENKSNKEGELLNTPNLITCDGQVVLHEQPLTIDLPFLPCPSKLEDFMDIVTTYKCKFCRFSCAWKSGLMSHIRSCHIDTNKKKIPDVPSQKEPEDNISSAGAPDSSTEDVCATSPVLRESDSKATSDMADSNDAGHALQATLEELSEEVNLLPTPIDKNVKIRERNVYLCGQCSRGFTSLDQCKKHMIKDHNLFLGVSKRGRKRVKRMSNPVSDASFLIERTLDEIDDVAEDCKPETEFVRSPGKRRIRTPKALEADFFLDQKTKRVRRDGLNDRPYRCNERGCGYRFKTEENLQYHARCHTIEEKAFNCPECNDKYEHWRGLVIHLWKQHIIDLDLYSCCICGYKSYSLFKLENHKRIHSDNKEFMCATCGKSFKQVSQLRNHHVIHLDRKNMPEKRWYSEQECEICHRRFSDSKCLRKHQQAVHSKMKPYSCTYCGHMSARKAMLQLHMRQHTGEKPFLCEHCDYRTGDHNSLRRHRMRHTGTKPYKCPHCSYACIQAISYKSHLKNKHPGLEGLYACQMCNFRSVNKENYMNHMSDHKRGALPTSDELGDEQQALVPASAQLHLPESTLHQLEGILPGNVLAAHLIYSCLNALSQEGGKSNLPPGVTTSSTGNGSQTITIQLPSSSNQDSNDSEQYCFTIQQQEGACGAALVGGTITPDLAITGDCEELRPVEQSSVAECEEMNCEAGMNSSNSVIHILGENNDEQNENILS